MLRDLKTNFKSLKFGKDQPGGGSSNSPYITTPLPENASIAQKIAIGAAGFSYDFPVRGGALALTNSAIDTIRIGKFLTDAPKGPLFIIKQVGLQLSNPKIETGKTLGLENTRTYNLGINTLAQIPVNAFGVHFDRAGLLPSISDQNKYATVVATKNTNTPNKNRLVVLYNEKILHDTPVNHKLQDKFNKVVAKVNRFNASKLGTFLNKVTSGGSVRTTQNIIEKAKRKLDPKYFLIDQYTGGPSSVYGIGTTTINRYVFSDEPRTTDNAPILSIDYSNLLGLSYISVGQDQLGFDLGNPTITPEYLKQTDSTDRTDDINNSVSSPGLTSTPDSRFNSLGFTYGILKKQKISDSSNSKGLIRPDFRKIINEEIGAGPNSALANTDYEQFNMEKRIGIGNPGKLTRDRRKINIVDLDTQDKINMIPLFKEEIEDTAGGTVTVNGVKYSTRDLIKFRFEAVDNDDPSKTTKIVFRAFINGFKDSLNADWDSYQYNGRGEKFYTYKGFGRSVSFGFKIAAQSRSEMKPLYQKLNYLMSNLAPDYQQNGFMRGSFMLLTMGNWFYRQPGIINNLSINVADNYPWEIAMDNPESGDDKTMNELPQVLDCNITFTPIHNFIPRKGATVPFIFTGTHEANKWLKPEEFTNL